MKKMGSNLLLTHLLFRNELWLNKNRKREIQYDLIRIYHEFDPFRFNFSKQIRGYRMKVTFYGTRGSTPVAEKDYVQFGGNTSCIMLTTDSGINVIFDAGTGIRNLGSDLIGTSLGQPFSFPVLDIPAVDIAILLSHTHWDHIQGFPFFKPAYDPQKNILIAICGKDRVCNDLESVFAAQMQSDFFPVPLDKMGSKIKFWQPDISQYTGPLGNTVKFLKHNHPGGAYSYRFTEGGIRLCLLY